MGNKVLLLRTCNSDLTSYGGFKWPESGHIEAPDWDATPRCGGGLHGLLWGEGDGNLLDWREEAKWLVFEADSEDVVNIDRSKSKAKKGKVVYCGDRKGATDYILAHNTSGKVLRAKRPFLNSYYVKSFTNSSNRVIVSVHLSGMTDWI